MLGKVASTKALLLVGWSAFQAGTKFQKESPKSDYVQEHLEDVLGLSFDVALHLESSWKPWASRHGLHFLRSVQRLPLLALCVFVAVFTVNTVQIQTSLSGLRRVWSRIRFEFWRRHYERNQYAFVAGLILTNEEIAAADALGIPTIELQHGVFDEDTALWYLNVKPKVVAIWPNQDGFALMRKGLTPVTLPFPPAQARTIREVERQELLVCLTWGLADSIDGFGAIPLGLWSELRSLEPKFNHLRFRLHPVFPRARRRKLERFLRHEYPNASVSSSERSLEEDLGGCEAVLLDRSSVWLDALRRGLAVLTTSKETFVKATEFQKTLMSGSMSIAFLPGEAGALETVLSADAGKVVDQSWDAFDGLIREILIGSPAA